MSVTHSKIIAAAAKAELAPVGFERKGQSRLWFADHGSWLNVVEFTPSRWSKSVSLMNAAHWLWLGAGFMSFGRQNGGLLSGFSFNLARSCATKSFTLLLKAFGRSMSGNRGAARLVSLSSVRP